MMVKNGAIHSRKRDAHRPTCQDHQEPTLSKRPLPDRRQIRVLIGWPKSRLRAGEVTARLGELQVHHIEFLGGGYGLLGWRGTE